MGDNSEPFEWHQMDLNAASELTKATETPGQVYQFDIEDAPKNFVRMSGACSYFVSAYMDTIETKGDVKVGGELLVGRTEHDLLKNYLYYFASSSDNKVFFAGPYKDFSGHHIATSTPIDVKTIFGHGPLSKLAKP